MNNNNNLLLWLNTKFVLGLCIIASAALGAFVFYQARALDNSLSVTGSATKNVVSDHVKWVSSISRITKLSTLKTSYATMANDLKSVQEFLKTNGIAEADIVISPISMNENYDQNYTPEKTYTLRQTVEVNSSDVNKVTDLAKHIQPLVDQGIIFATDFLEYTYTKLSAERVAMLGLAVQDAKARASMLAESSGKKIGKLKSASSGVVQVLSENSLDVSDYGSYDTSKVNKTIMVTVKAAFTLK